MSAPIDRAWYVYAVIAPGQPAPDVPGLLPGTTVDAISFGTVDVLATLVPRALFEDGQDGNRTDDPDWMAERAAAHHAVVAAAASRQACLPLGFGTLFSSLDRLAEWLRPRAAALRDGIARIAGAAEWCLAICADPARHGAWLARHDAELQRLARQAETAGAGTAFLLAKRIDKAQVAARLGHLASVEARISALLMATGWPVLAERQRDGSPAWSILAPADAAAAPLVQQWLAVITEELAPSGLAVRLTGPWPAYAFARAAMQAEAAHV
jgi:hypothetical protein